MTTRALRRGTPPRGRAPAKRRGAPKPSRLDRLMAALPIGEAGLRKLAMAAVLVGGAGVAGAAALALGVPAIVGDELAEASARAGFRVSQIDVTGLHRMDRDTVYAWAMEGSPKNPPIFAVRLDTVRQNLLRYGWIADAHVSRRLPDTLLIDIVERSPAAVWQDHGHLTLIDASGVLLDPVDPNAMPDLPLVIGPGADKQAPAYQALLAAAPSLKNKVRAATWVGDRRWDLQFASGETLKLPEDGAEAALRDFASRNAQHPLLGRGWMSFDLRDPTKLVARRPERQLADPGDGKKEG